MLAGDRIQGERKEAGPGRSILFFAFMSESDFLDLMLIICLIMNQEEMSRHQIQCSH